MSLVGPLFSVITTFNLYHLKFGTLIFYSDKYSNSEIAAFAAKAKTALHCCKTVFVLPLG